MWNHNKNLWNHNKHLWNHNKNLWNVRINEAETWRPIINIWGQILIINLNFDSGGNRPRGVFIISLLRLSKLEACRFIICLRHAQILTIKLFICVLMRTTLKAITGNAVLDLPLLEPLTKSRIVTINTEEFKLQQVIVR